MDRKKSTTKRGKWKQLSEKERYQIEALTRRRVSPAEIGKQLNRDRRTIEREIARGSVVQRDTLLKDRLLYCADAGQRVCEEHARNKGRGLKIGYDHKLAKHIEDKIAKEKYSPDAVIGEIKEKGLVFGTSICTKTVYNMIDQGFFLNISNKDLSVKKNGKKRKNKKVRSVALKNLKGKNIEERPQEIESREEYGHWEMDLVVGKTRVCLLVLTERQSREELIFKIKSKEQKRVINVLDKLEKKYGIRRFKKKFKSFTMDNGSEFLNSKALERSCLNPSKERTTCYYAHPYSAWERGSNEVNNKLIRRFIPKGSDIGKFTQRDVKRIEIWMNNYPRRMFGYRSANDICNAA